MAKMTSVPNLKLNNGNEIPIVGLGTWKSKQGEVQKAVECAIDGGYRHIDCARAYGNEKEVGDALASKMASGVVKREEIFVTSKCWNVFHAAKDVRGTLMDSLKDLQLKYLDLYLIHWPQGYVNNGEMFPKDANGKFIYTDDDYVDTWKAFIELQKEGLIKNIGVSNFNEYQIGRLIKESTVVPCMNQIEVNPYLVNDAIIKYCQSNQVAITAYSPLGSPDRPWAAANEPVLLEDSKLMEMAKRLNKSPAQIVLRFQIQRNVIVIPKSVTPSRIQSNFQLFDFKLSDEDMKVVAAFNRDFRGCALGWVSDHKYYPFKENYTE